MNKKDVVEYVTTDGHSPFGKWFSQLDPQAAAKVTTALYRLEQGIFTNTKSVGKGVFEYKLDYGPGYRIYFGQDGDVLVILLIGGTKKRQTKDIKQAQFYWNNFKNRKKQL